MLFWDNFRRNAENSVSVDLGESYSERRIIYIYRLIAALWSLALLYAYLLRDVFYIPTRKILKNAYNSKIFRRPSKSCVAPLLAVLFSSTAFTQTAHAQFCTAEQLNVGSTGFEGRDASGNPAGFDGNDVQVGDFLVFSDTVIAGYNPAAAIDVVFEITDINLNSAVPPHSADSNRVTVNNSGRLTLQGAISMSDPYVCLLYTSPSPRDKRQSRMPSSA